MKKLMIMLVAVGAVVAANAAAFTWKTSATGKLYSPGDSSTLLASGTAYLFDSASVTQQAILTAFSKGTALDSLTSLDSSSVSSGAIAAKSASPITISEGNAYTLGAIVALVTTVDSQEYIFISDVTTKNGSATGTTALSVALATASKRDVTEFSAASATFGSGGWYTAAVPEPTSGLLMLLGVAGLALRRRRA